ncbi:deoxyguanosinetriphosphate triphosphohydrolase [Algiphilus sp. NNCM1]|uniref:deoxyguanosinetriphosphate triphosphohydrolase n=1 Tax=Algiphilus sp. TaxID=1872431 RepID=UPI001CA7A2AE|nr:deoxyguanosinetriphosphate triphosphohydrolase [Algiphilus sp.]MBY8964095.1 deoxyguanosinetriphosphate triphosphohydrolase [Algiphilus acroporae]MCI5063612.1 deoxyguanosinetriphosphate triphosphohydrolase [Algiphilus sp.]MCI5104620.1 deoxyguanosinetriphosphate triphosphohydrolase [Algiphilus sp.]
MQLAPWASDSTHTRGRRYPEDAPSGRSDYQRDRDRIVHSGAFRRLEYKTQVFLNHEGDWFRTRLTHSLEVAQIARSLARSLSLNEDLVEAICLAHDLGHTPFGHAGQDALNQCMRDYGGFEHNLQSLRVVDELEDKYADFRGLNLTFETREGILKHCSKARARELGDLGRRFLDGTQPSLEAQLANLADEIAYNNHDIDDGIRAGLISLDELEALPLVAKPLAAVRSRHPDATPRQRQHEVIRRLITLLVDDLRAATEARLAEVAPADADAARAQSRPIVAFSNEMRAQATELKRFLYRRVYRHHRVYRMTRKAQRVVRDLFEVLLDDPLLLPPEHQARAAAGREAEGDAGSARAVADYIAGMTDRYALHAHGSLFNLRQVD